jgi:hypothetical protein
MRESGQDERGSVPSIFMGRTLVTIDAEFLGELEETSANSPDERVAHRYCAPT